MHGAFAWCLQPCAASILPHRSLLQQHAALGVHRRRLRVRQAEGVPIELVNVLREAAEADVYALRRGIWGVAAAEGVVTFQPQSAVNAKADTTELLMLMYAIMLAGLA